VDSFLKLSEDKELTLGGGAGGSDFGLEAALSPCAIRCFVDRELPVAALLCAISSSLIPLEFFFPSVFEVEIDLARSADFVDEEDALIFESRGESPPEKRESGESGGGECCFSGGGVWAFCFP
jgi:hypothetical protein